MNQFIEWIKDSKNNVISKDFEKAIEKISKLEISKTHVVADFDMTLTQYLDSNTGKRSMSSHGVLENWKGMTLKCKDSLNLLYKKYYPIEISTTIPHDEKVKAMEEWWGHAHEIIIESKIKIKDIQEMVHQSKGRIILRPCLFEFLDLLLKMNIPLLVFSAGLGDIILNVFKLYLNLNDYNLEIISNWMLFDENDNCIGFKEPLIHVFNKNETGLFDNDTEIAGSHSQQHQHQHHFKKETIKNRESVILMGDSLGDLKMADGLTHDVKLTVGFLNHDFENFKDLYLDAFDLVLINDTSLEFFIRLLKVLRRN